MRRHGAEEAVLLEKENPGKVFLGEHGLALAMTRYVLERYTAGNDRHNEPAASPTKRQRWTRNLKSRTHPEAAGDRHQILK
jgi:hypothetical protein